MPVRPPSFKNGARRGLWLACAAGLTLAGCTSEADRKSLQDGFAKYSAHQVEESEAIADKYIAANPAGENLDEAFYLRGLSRFTRDNRAGAAADLRQAEKISTRPDLKGKALRALGDIDFEQSRWSEAQTDYEKALTEGAGTFNAANITHLNYHIGACLQALGQWEKARPWFARAIAANGDPTLTERARLRFDAGSFSLQFGAFHEVPRARELSDQLKAAGMTPSIATDYRDGQLIYIVRSGAYNTWTDATAARERVQARYPLVTIVP